MWANISTLPTPSVTAWDRCSSVAAFPPARPSIRVAVHSGRAMSSGDCSITSARSNTCLSEPGSATRILSYVEVQVEVGIDNPARRGGRQGRHDHFLPQPQHASGRILKAGPEAVPIRGGVQDFQSHDARAGTRVGLAAMQEVIDRPQRRGQSGRVDRLSHRHSSVLSPRPLLDAPIRFATAQRCATGHSNASPVGAMAVADCADQKTRLNVSAMPCELPCWAGGLEL